MLNEEATVPVSHTDAAWDPGIGPAFTVRSPVPTPPRHLQALLHSALIKREKHNALL